MTRRRIRDIRNEEFIAATIEVIHARGYAQATTAEIAKAAGSTGASINYYFGSKERLMEATMRHLLEVLRKAALTRFATAQGPRARLEAIVAANFDAELFTPAQCSVWTQFWSQAPYSASLARLQHINRSRVRSNMAAELSQLLPTARQHVIRRQIQAHMDGLWLEAAQADPAKFDAERARQEALQLVAELL